MRRGGRSLYNGNLGLIFDNSSLDARPFSLTGQDTPRPNYSRLQGVLSVGGPLRIPKLLPRNGPNITLNYQWLRNRDITTQAGLMPSLALRNAVPQNEISPQARALLALYPLPNFDNNARYNYQVSLTGATHQDNLQSRWNQRLTVKNQLSGNVAYQSTRTDSTNLFGFQDKSSAAGVNTGVNWVHPFTARKYSIVRFQFSRFSSETTPYFANRQNISGEAGIQGNNQDPVNWGPPTLVFSSGINGLSDAQASQTHNQTTALGADMGWSRNSHNLLFGVEYRWQQFNLLTQQDPRGTFVFTGDSDFANFLRGLPSTSSIAFGNADKYMRAKSAAAYFTDDWRVNSAFTLNAGLRWEYGSPVTERYGRLVNLDVASGFTAITPVIAQQQTHPLVRADRNNFAPRVAFAWRPLPASSLVVRGGYGVYYDTSIYQTIATQMAQQPPLSKTLRVATSNTNPLTLGNGFFDNSKTVANTFGVDPDFRTGYVHEWQLSLQRDLPGSLQVTGAYLGIKGTRAMQQFLPNTYPVGAVNPCPACPVGFTYVTSNGNSTRESGQVQVRRRLHSGFTASVQYTLAKSIDDASALGGTGSYAGRQAQSSPGTAITVPVASVVAGTTAQDWLNLRGERSLSSFDQRHLVAIQAEYTSGMGTAGGTLMSGWKGRLLKQWTFSWDMRVGSGLPETPLYLAAVQGTGVTGAIRPDYTGAPIHTGPPGVYLNQAAYTAPAAGRWGNAGRNSITGPAQFTANASAGRTFRINDRFNLDFRVDSTNALNHVTFTGWNTSVTNAQFGLPVSANSMRVLQTNLRLRF